MLLTSGLSMATRISTCCVSFHVVDAATEDIGRSTASV